MKCSCFGSSGIVLDNESKKAEHEHVSSSQSQPVKDDFVRLVHAGGRIEMYENALPVSELTQKYPGMCIARPDVFRQPHQSVLSPDDLLLPGNKYFVVRSSTVEKLRRRKSGKGRKKDGPAIADCCKDDQYGLSDESTSSCRSGDYAPVSKHGWSGNGLKETEKKTRKQVPIQRPRIWKEPEWEPSLTSIQELSV